MGNGDSDLPLIPLSDEPSLLLGPEGIPLGPQPLLPRPGQGAKDASFDRQAATSYKLDEVMRGTVSRHRLGEARQRGEELAYQARSWDDLYRLVRRETASHSIDVDGPLAQALADAAVATYRKRVGDDGWAAMAVGIGLEKSFVEDQRAAVASLAKALEREEEQQYQLFLQELEAIRTEPQRAALRRLIEVHPAEIQSSVFKMGGVAEPLYQLFKAIAPYISLALNFVPVVGQVKGVLEGIVGQDVVTGRKLAAWERGLGAALSLAPFARGAFGVARAGVGAAAQGARYGIRGIAAIAFKAKELKGIDPRRLYLALRGLSKVDAADLRILSRIPTANLARGVTTTAEQTAARSVAAALDVLEAGGAAGSRTATGTLSSARNPLTATASGTIIAKAAPAAAKTAHAMTKAAQGLVSKGYNASAIRALEQLGVRVTAKLAKQLDELGDVGKVFLNLFHQSKGFHRVIGDLAKGGNSAEGARFVMRFAAKDPDILTKVTANPALVAFEVGMGKIATRRFGDIFAREVDIVVRGDSKLGVGYTIHTELKNWTAKSLQAAKSKKLGRQLAKDIAIFEPTALGRTVSGDTIRWIFNAAKIRDQNKIIDVFITVIRKDPYLSARWGDNATRIREVLEKLIVLR